MGWQGGSVLLRELAARLNDLNLTSRIHMWRERKELLKLHLTPTRSPRHVCPYKTNTCNLKNNKNDMVLFAGDSAQRLAHISLCRAGRRMPLQINGCPEISLPTTHLGIHEPHTRVPEPWPPATLSTAFHSEAASEETITGLWL